MRRSALIALLVAPLVVGSLPVSAAGPVRVVDCDPGSLSPALVAAGIVTASEAPDAEGDQDDQVDEDQLPKIVGSIAKPRGTGENDAKLSSLATVSREQAVWNATGAVADPSQRRVSKALVEGENGFVVWAIKTVRIDPASGPDPRLEVKLDAGGSGAILSIECDPDDD